MKRKLLPVLIVLMMVMLSCRETAPGVPGKYSFQKQYYEQQPGYQSSSSSAETNNLFGTIVNQQQGMDVSAPTVELVVESHNEAGASHDTLGSVHWSYAGINGPVYWGSLTPEYETCSLGKSQSPIDIATTAKANLAQIEFNYNPSQLSIVNNGHAIQVDYSGGSSIRVDGATFELLQLHFHSPSENTINGRIYEMEMHLVHRASSGEMAVVGVLIEAGAENAAYAPIWLHMPTKQGDLITYNDISVNANDLLPAERGYYLFTGSLTTPPCTEGVRWLLLTTPVQLSGEQIAAFKAIYSNNVRPVQPLNGRNVLVQE